MSQNPAQTVPRTAAAAPIAALSSADPVPAGRIWTTEGSWEHAIASSGVGHPSTVLLGALLLVARVYADAARVAVAVRSGSGREIRRLEVDLPVELSVADFMQQVELAAATAPIVGTEAAPNWSVTLDGGDREPSSADVDLDVTTGPQVRVVLSMRDRYGDAAAAERLLAHLGQALHQMCADPGAAIGDVDVRTDAEREGLAAVNAARTPPDGTVVDLFLARVEADASAVAVIDDRGTTTYAEVEQASRLLAARLLALGAGQGRTVGVFVGRGATLVTTLLAVLRTGAAYVPIDAAGPALRRNQVLRDAGVVVLVSDRPVEVPEGVRLLDVTVPQVGPEGLLSTAPAGNDPAYVMYTSGSTGAPKGVVVSHRAVMSRVCGVDYAPLTASTRLLQVGSVAFDATTFEIWGPLANGGAVVFAGDLPTPDSLRDAVRRQGVNMMFLTTALFHHLVDADPTCLNGCVVIVGGEVVSHRHLARAFQNCQDSTFVHAYGPTENTTFSTVHRVDHAPTADIPIGRPIAFSTASVVGFDGRPKPVGVAGELWVGGAGVADGYLGLPELTAERFTVAPDGSGARCYRTGDIARWSADLQLEFVGRTDTQVKLRGFRIELGEIEAHVRACPGVRDAVVVPQDAGDGILCAFFTADRPVEPADIRTELSTRLPGYMVPSRYEELTSFPLTSNNKVDRGALARRRPAGMPAAAGGTVTGTPPLVEHIARVFAEVLGVPSVAATDNFFDLGGHSLLAMRVWTRLRADLGLDFELRHVIDSPTVMELAAVLTRPGTTRRPRLPLGSD